MCECVRACVCVYAHSRNGTLEHAARAGIMQSLCVSGLRALRLMLSSAILRMGGGQREVLAFNWLLGICLH